MANTSVPPLTEPILFDPQVDCRFALREIEAEAIETELENIQFDADYRAVAEKKFHHQVLKAQGLSAPGANVLKQTCLSLGTDAGVHHGAINCTIDREAVLITATDAQLEKLLLKLRPQPFGLKPLSQSISRMRLRQKRLQQNRLQVMAILNLTPDSFSDGGQFSHLDAVLQAVQNWVDSGIHWLDMGAESTRPGARAVDADEQMRRLIPALNAVRGSFPNLSISVDTRLQSVAQAAIDAGANMINDVSGLTFDPAMLPYIASTQCPVVLMHSQGTPETMQVNPHYEDVVETVSQFFYQQVAKLVEAGGHPSQVILDPGFGFGKTGEHNLTLLKRLPELVSIGFPVLAGLSRKSFLTLGQPIPPEVRDTLTVSALTLAAQSGVQILRLHNPISHLPVVRLLQALHLAPC